MLFYGGVIRDPYHFGGLSLEAHYSCLKRSTVYWTHVRAQQAKTALIKMTFSFFSITWSIFIHRGATVAQPLRIDLDELARFPNIKRMLVRLNTGILSGAPAKCLFSKECDVFSIKKGRFPDDNIERPLILSYNKFLQINFVGFSLRLNMDALCWVTVNVALLFVSCNDALYWVCFHLSELPIFMFMFL